MRKRLSGRDLKKELSLAMKMTLACLSATNCVALQHVYIKERIFYIAFGDLPFC